MQSVEENLSEDERLANGRTGTISSESSEGAAPASFDSTANFMNAMSQLKGLLSASSSADGTTQNGVMTPTTTFSLASSVHNSGGNIKTEDPDSAKGTTQELLKQLITQPMTVGDGQKMTSSEAMLRMVWRFSVIYYLNLNTYIILSFIY